MENYRRTGSSDLRKSVLNGKYLKNSLKRDFKKHCFIKKELVIPTHQRHLQTLKVTHLECGSIIKGHTIKNRKSYRRTGSSSLRK